MKKNKDLIVSLCGGLGNQFFQISHGLSISKGTLIVEKNFGHPRLNKQGNPEISSFSLPERILFQDFARPSAFLSRAASYLLRSRSNPSGIEKIGAYRKVITIICNVIFTFYFKKPIRVVKSLGIGIKEHKKNPLDNLQIGYFQSYLTSEDPTVLSDLKGMTPVQLSSLATKLIEDVSSGNVLVVHVRLGDYKNEKDFGMPSPRYYEEAIKIALNQEIYSEIWIFSDEIFLAKEKIRIKEELPIRWIGDEGLTTAETFEIMKSGNGFVIANSSFSWWAARLSYENFPLVVAPMPWFKNLREPDNLIPPEWLRIDANYD